ncbi:MAG: isoprenylcysteine carboxylmethyltransferase family protein [Terracidiphilus sp.]
MLRTILFFAASAAIVSLSWRSLKDAHTHGFYRFFAFELLLGLILWNAPLWWRDPLSWRQLASYLLGAVSIGLAIEGFRLMRVIGQPAPGRIESTNLAFENTTTLVTLGVYRWIRHPLYASLLALTGCAYFKNPTGLASIVLTLGTSGCLLGTALAEEGENLKRFGAAYADYKKRTQRFIPFVF